MKRWVVSADGLRQPVQINLSHDIDVFTKISKISSTAGVKLKSLED